MYILFLSYLHKKQKQSTLEITPIDSSVPVVIPTIVKIVSWSLLLFNEGVLLTYPVLLPIYGVESTLPTVKYKTVSQLIVYHQSSIQSYFVNLSKY